MGTRVVDALLTWLGGRRAVKTDGPSHFLPSGAPSTATRLRDHVLGQWGIPVLSVPVAGRLMAYQRSAAFRRELAAQLRARGVPLPMPATQVQSSAG